MTPDTSPPTPLRVVLPDGSESDAQRVIAALESAGFAPDVRRASAGDDPAAAPARERFRDMADEAPVLIWVSGPDGRGEFANRRYREFTGRPPGAGGGDGWHADLHPDDRAAYVALDREAHVERRPFVTQARYRRHDGEYRWMQVVATPRTAADGSFDGFVGTCTDITDLKDTEAALQEADRKKNEFLAMLAHELRNPLAALRVATDLLRTPNADPAWALDVLGHQITHMGRLVDDLLDVSRLNRGLIMLRQQPVDLGEVLRRAADVSRPHLDSRRHALEVVGPAEPLVVEGDPARLEQVFANLLHNAAKYTPPGGRVTVEAHDGDGLAKVSVRDTGVGIAPEVLPRVFDLFVQADRSLERSDGGLGIGLTLVRHLVTLHGGTVEARSDGPGRGSEFVVRLPICAGETVPADDPRPVARRPRRVLIVDDNRAAADGLATLLRIEGHAVAVAYDGPAAVAAALADPPQVIVLDIGLPGRNGFDVAKQLRAEPALAGVRLVALTGYGTDADRSRAVASGFDYYLVKPADVDDLREVLAER